MVGKKRLAHCVVLLFAAHLLWAQGPGDTIRQEQIKEWVTFLASDSLKGRGNYTAGQQQAAQYIANHFQQWNLSFLPGLESYFHSYTVEEEAKAGKKKPVPQKALVNVVGVLPGRLLPHECIVFSAHYDHIGEEDGVIHNGANDNASGTAAVLALAQYYAQRADNERTLIFCAFSGEELGLWGSTAFAQLLKAGAVKAVINIEMIGKQGAAGKNALFITGAQYSDFAAIFKRNLQGFGVKVKREPNYEKELFKRSDNFPFALKGVPAHSVMCSDDDDPCYHRSCDDVDALDLPNMTTITRAIVKGCTSLVNGTDTPKRIKPNRIN